MSKTEDRAAIARTLARNGFEGVKVLSWESAVRKLNDRRVFVAEYLRAGRLSKSAVNLALSRNGFDRLTEADIEALAELGIVGVDGDYLSLNVESVVVGPLF